MKTRWGFSKPVGLGLLAVSAMLVLGASPAFAWHVVLPPNCTSVTNQVQPCFTTTNSGSSATVGATVWDTATIQLSDSGPSTYFKCAAGAGSTYCPYGYLTFAVYTGTCSGLTPTGTLVFTSNPIPVTKAAETAATTYTSNSWDTTGAAATSYVWVSTYSGTGYMGYPKAQASCEPFILTPPQSHGAPEFPAGLPLLLAIAIPAMLLAKRRVPGQ